MFEDVQIKSVFGQLKVVTFCTGVGVNLKQCFSGNEVIGAYISLTILKVFIKLQEN